MTYFKWVIPFAILFVFGCKSNQEVTTKEPETVGQQEPINLKPVVLASIQRTACFGQCPMYKISYMDNGQVTYVGKRFVEKIGTYSTLLNEDEILSITDMVEDLNYFELDSLYPTPVSDFPSCITEVQINGKHKRVINRRNPPENLRSFEKFLDSLIEGKKLRKDSDNTDYMDL